MTGDGACDLGRLTRPSTIASARTAIGERIQIALIETSRGKRIRQSSNRYRGRKVRFVIPSGGTQGCALCAQRRFSPLLFSSSGVELRWAHRPEVYLPRAGIVRSKGLVEVTLTLSHRDPPSLRIKLRRGRRLHSGMAGDSIRQKTFVADDPHFFQQTSNAARQKIEAHASESRCIFSTKEKWRDC